MYNIHKCEVMNVPLILLENILGDQLVEETNTREKQPQKKEKSECNLVNKQKNEKAKKYKVFFFMTKHVWYATSNTLEDETSKKKKKPKTFANKDKSPLKTRSNKIF